MNCPSNAFNRLFTVPNLLTCFRFVAAPCLLWLAWRGYDLGFLILLAVSFLTDALDGLAARWFGEVSHFGAMLDSWADMILYCTIALSAWWLWPDVVLREAPFAAMIVFSYLLPPLIGILKFGAFTSYHTWIVKIAAASVGLSFFVLFLGGPAWPFRIAAFVCVLAASEEISITLIANELYTNVSSVWDVKRRLARARKPDSTKSDANS
jgi:phosphatidylglycerophosphate synthase